MANPEIATNFNKLGPLQEKLSTVKKQIDSANDDWGQAIDELDKFE